MIGWIARLGLAMGFILTSAVRAGETNIAEAQIVTTDPLI
jgi:hypothetical protein